MWSPLSSQVCSGRFLLELNEQGVESMGDRDSAYQRSTSVTSDTIGPFELTFCTVGYDSWSFEGAECHGLCLWCNRIWQDAYNGGRAFRPRTNDPQSQWHLFWSGKLATILLQYLTSVIFHINYSILASSEYQKATHQTFEQSIGAAACHLIQKERIEINLSLGRFAGSARI